jgi:hypothetical protein
VCSSDLSNRLSSKGKVTERLSVLPRAVPEGRETGRGV